MSARKEAKRVPFGAYVPHNRVSIDVGGESRTRQEFAEECDINSIMRNFAVSGNAPVNTRQPRYLDLTEVPDFRAAMDLMIEAKASFMQLPAVVRREFDNDPAKFVDFASDPENIDKMREWGLTAPEEPVAAPMRVEVVNQPPADLDDPAPSPAPKKGQK